LGDIWVEINLDPISEKEWGFLLIALEFREEKPAAKVKNVGKGEGVFRWILGLVGVVVILTAIFGY